ncbi:hypothetical protein Mal64_00360 [Pseudobythopirellula maris]|uniref:Sulfotransferase domain-containing protein n=1 Tax=Pseudobythopirellula maris TaxID=2527991 RepID=A0A5C5ZRW1_9BACT|nr:sulfotransferase family 2 domain-containing protein [Pseudobythopirellula maris]TWT89657.1 hypothetical protein Mal64_00360 [Pseudobythopirellula maris]
MASLTRYAAYLHYATGRARRLFIHIPKNAGVAIRKSPLLRGRLVACEPGFYRCRGYYQRLRRTMDAAGEHHGLHHARLRDVAPSVRRRLRPVAVVRNPWARVVSRYRFARMAMRNQKTRQNYAAGSFEAFLEERHEFGNRDLYWHRAIRGWYPQVDYLVDDSGDMAADVLRQETLGGEARRYFGLDEDLQPRNITTGKLKPYQDFYTPRTLQIVADWYEADLETFGFDFDTGAKKNCFFAADETGDQDDGDQAPSTETLPLRKAA